MNLNKTTLVVPLVAVLLIVAAGAVFATSGDPSAPLVAAPAAATPSPTPAPSDGRKGVQKDDVLTGVLDDLVTKGTITDAQRKAIVDGVATERTARQEARKVAREQAMADWKQLKDFLSDGVITKAEFDKLPATSPLRKVTTLMDDGKITTDELKTLGMGWFGGGMGGHGMGGMFGGKGGHGWGNGAKPGASASPTTGG